LQELKLQENLLQGRGAVSKGKKKKKTQKYATTNEAVLIDLVPFHELPSIILEVSFQDVKVIIKGNDLSSLGYVSCG
jgi:hypothetical protein